MSETKQRAPYPLRMPDEMRDALKEAAKKNDRSLNAEIVARLSDTLLKEQSDTETLEAIQREMEIAMNKLRLRIRGLDDESKEER